MKFDQMLGSDSCPYEFNLELEKGTKYPGKPPYPELLVLSNDTAHVREIRWQRVVVRASIPETGKMDNVQIMRLVAVLEGGQEMEMSRIALPVDIENDTPEDPTTCAACHGKIPHGAGTKHEVKWYHTGRCLLE